MVEAVKGLKGKIALDMGTGSGIVARELAKRFEKVVAVDINPEILNLKFPKNVKVIVSNLFKNVNGKFDLIVFNAPYLPCPYEEDKELCCGNGEIIERFLKEAKNHLTKNGKILLLISSLTPVKVKEKIILKKKVAFEEIMVIEINKDD